MILPVQLVCGFPMCCVRPGTALRMTVSGREDEETEKKEKLHRRHGYCAQESHRPQITKTNHLPNFYIKNIYLNIRQSFFTRQKTWPELTIFLFPIFTSLRTRRLLSMTAKPKTVWQFCEPMILTVFTNSWSKPGTATIPAIHCSMTIFFYRVERTVALYGVQFCARKMPEKVPEFTSLGFPNELTRMLLSLSGASGLILWSGPTGAGKTTSISALMKEFLVMEGGFAYTIEDPTEMPLDGVYRSVRGGLGLCKQTQPVNGNWGASLKSALRSKPRYILVGEIRTPDTASEVLRAATSGHLVLSSIHANNITDAIYSVIKYAASSEMSEDLAFDLFSRGILGVMHQTLFGIKSRKPSTTYLFANPDTTQGDQVRGIIKSGKLNLATSIEMQMTRLPRGMNIFPEN